MRLSTMCKTQKFEFVLVFAFCKDFSFRGRDVPKFLGIRLLEIISRYTKGIGVSRYTQKN